MPRARRWFVPGVTAHIVKRGNNRSSIFSKSVDYERFLEILESAAHRHEGGVHAYALMTNHIHLMVTPTNVGSVPAMMKELGEQYSQYFNKEYLRTGTPWDGRYRAFLVQDERYWLTCLRYVELNPVRAGMVARPEHYPWSSYAAHALARPIRWLQPHPLFTSLAASDMERRAVYERLCRSAITEDDVRRLRARPAYLRQRTLAGGQTPGSDPQAG